MDAAIEIIKSTSHLGSRPGTKRLEKLLKRMGNPQEHLKYIHVAGTNGKGSTCAMIAQILKESGYQVGLFTSPYLEKINEQIQINNEMISEEDLSILASLVNECMKQLTIEELPTEFEIITAIAFLYFHRKNCDFVVLETGLGGSFDATNVISRKEVAVITNIGIDHTQFLGNEISQIANHKAGIIVKDSIMVSYEQMQEVLEVLNERCDKCNVPSIYADFSKIKLINTSVKGQSFCYGDHQNLFLPLLGEHQLKNAAVAIETINALIKKGFLIGESAINDGLAHVVWPARFECLHEKPYVFLDGGHNTQCVSEFIKIINQHFKDKRIIFVIGVMADKDYHGMFQLLAPYAKEFIAVRPKNERALSTEELVDVLKQYGSSVYKCGPVHEGITLSLNHATEQDVICAIGSLYMAGEIRAYFKN